MLLKLLRGEETPLSSPDPSPQVASQVSCYTASFPAVLWLLQAKLPLHTGSGYCTVHYCTVQYCIGNAVLVQYSPVALFMPGILDSLPRSSEGPKAPIALHCSSEKEGGHRPLNLLPYKRGDQIMP